MFLGHYALAFGAKRLAPTVSLGTLFLACQFADLLWPTLVLLEVERVEIDPGNTLVTPLNFVSYPYSHSLAMLAVWSAVLALLYRAVRGPQPVAIATVGALVVSHYVLDAITHRPDLPLTIGGTQKIGLGLWNYPGTTLAVESAMFLAGAGVYVTVTRERDRIGKIGLLALIATLAAVYFAALHGPPPPNARAVAGVAHLAWVFVLWAYGIDRHRQPRRRPQHSRMPTMTRIAFAVMFAAAANAATAQPIVSEKAVDAVFARWNHATPGCAVAVAAGGKPVLMKAYGMADLEHDVPNTPDTVFESGSVAKQFTAMTILLLARDGKLSLDDQVRKHIPELPDYGVPLTIRHMLTHTSGLRDWGSVAGIAGAPRTSREYTHGHVLDIVSRQKSLNFTPGTQYSYSNTGYNLSAIIVSRLSGMSFAEFSKRRIFEPLGMRHTQWRDDHQRVVKKRAVAYRPEGDGFRIEMPFENVHGNGGLLTTVGDLLKWNENFVNPRVGDAALVAQQQTPGTFPDGRPQSYALGLRVGSLGGVSNINHSGSTAGYVAHLNRFPQAHLSVAVLCNVSSGRASDAAQEVSLLYLGNRAGKPDPPAERDPEPPTIDVPAAALRELVGRYWSDEAETALVATIEKDRLVLKRRPDATIALRPIGKDTFDGSIGRVTFIRDASGSIHALSVRQDRVWDLRFARQ